MTRRRIPVLSHTLLAAALALAPAVTGRAEEQSAVSAAEPSPDDLGSLLRRQTQELMDAIAPGEIDVWRRYLLDDAVYLDEDGVVHDKASLLRELKPLPPLAARHTAAVLKDPPAIVLSREELCAYAGIYRLTEEIVTTVTCNANGLVAERSGRPPETLHAEVRDVFFVAGKPRSRRIFLRDDGKVVAFVDRREGEDVRWTRLPATPQRPGGNY